MKGKHKIGLGVLLVAAATAGLSWYLPRHNVAMLNSAGPIGRSERDLIIFTASLAVVVVVPVFALLFTFAWKYREDNPKAKYTPELSGSRMAETIWWLIPTVLLIIISLVNWHSTYALDPFKPIASNTPELPVQVVAMDWRWLFIYPTQHVASLNRAMIPAGTPIDFQITSDSVMNSFWVPQLGGQMYAMPGMVTHQHLLADKPGTYLGRSANISGKGFAGMQFDVQAVSPASFRSWAAKASHAPESLTAAHYQALAQPSQDHQVVDYAAVEPGLFDSITMKYMEPGSATTQMNPGTKM